jgi:hypothetical protein
MPDYLPFIRHKGTFTFGIQGRCQLRGVHLPRNDGLDIRIHPSTPANGIAKELEDIVIHQPVAAANTVSPMVTPPPETV